MTSLRRALLALAALALLAGIGSAALIHASEHVDDRGLLLALTLGAGWSFSFTGLYAWDRRPGSPIGPLMTLIGFTWFFQGLAASNDSAIYAIGVIGQLIPYAILIQLLVSFPGSRPQTAPAWIAVGFAYLATGPLQIAWAFFVDPQAQEGCENCPENPIKVGPESVADAINGVQVIGGMAAIVVGIAVLFAKWRRSTAAERQVLTPVLATGGLAFSILLVQLVLDKVGASGETKDVVYVAAVAVFAFLPPAFLLGLLRSRVGRAEEESFALSTENAQLIAELRASRHRIVEAGYAERRRVERDLHDGAQQRLMALTMNLRLAREKLDANPAVTGELLDEAMEELAAATAELRELARGIHPVVLTDRGLAAALSGLAERSPVPVEIVAAPSERLPAPVESATYFVVAEALTNVARYAEAEVATVRVARDNGVVEVEITDDGVGGADPEGGTGLRGLADRVAALDGRLEVRSAAGAGTTVAAVIPCA